ncbi:MAG: hypothetical protein AAB250_00075, partial [Bdellovibrionota bacterium]
YKVEALLRNVGKVNFVAGKPDEETVVRDGNLITARNFQSAKKFGDAIVEYLRNNLGEISEHGLPTADELKKSIAEAKDPFEKFEHQSHLMLQNQIKLDAKLSDPVPQEQLDLAREIVKCSKRFPEHPKLCGSPVNAAHEMLGWVLLQKGDVAGAKEELARAGATPTDPPLLSFGMNFALARELLKRGEKKAVLDYLDRAEAHYFKGPRSGAGRAEVGKYRDLIARGEIPEFFMGK